jgi:uncharacterized membrane protein YesL
MSSGLAGGLYTISLWISRLAYLNALWILFTLGGFVVLGVFPATAAVFTVMRYWNQGKEEVPVFQTFWRAYKSSFGQIQIIGYLLVGICAILYFNYHFFMEKEGVLFTAAKVGTGSIIIIVMIVLIYIFPVYVHYELGTLEYLKNALFIGLSHLLHSFVMIIVTAIFIYAFLKYSGYLFLITVSIIAFWNTWVSQIVFKKIEMLSLKTSNNGRT